MDVLQSASGFEGALKYAIWQIISPLSGTVSDTLSEIMSVLDNMLANVQRVAHLNQWMGFWRRAITAVKAIFSNEILKGLQLTGAGAIKKHLYKYRWDTVTESPVSKATNEITGTILTIPWQMCDHHQMLADGDLWLTSYSLIKGNDGLMPLHQIVLDLKNVFWMCFEVCTDKAADTEERTKAAEEDPGA